MPAYPISRRRSRLARLTAFVALCLMTAAPAIAATDEHARSAGTNGPAGEGFAGVSGDAGRTADPFANLTTSSTSAVGATPIEGIDVSHWQGAIDWSRVAGRGKAFAYLKSTDDVDYLDPTFAYNRAEAAANGLAVGAYHFARPDGGGGDAVREARWFVEQTDPRPGELLPVLDIETNDGLTQTEMTTWAHRWVEEVRDLTGVTPMVYTSPYGWLDRFGDTRRLARDGSPLWVAHWGVTTPLVPAGNWDGNGWELWQYSSKGRVAGISGDVDLDRLAGDRLGRLTIRRLRVDVLGDASVVTSMPSGLGCAATCVRNVDPDISVTLTALPDEDAYFTGWEGACTGTAATCTLTMRGNRAVTATFVTDITPPVPSLTEPNGLADPVTVTFDERVRGVSGANVVLRRSGGGDVTVTRTCRSGAGAPVACATGKVRSVELLPSALLVPGRAYETVVNPGGAAPVADLVGNPAGTTTMPFIGRTTVDQDRAPVDHAWRVVHNASALGGTFVVERLPGAELSFDFRGRSVTWRTVMGPSYGRALVLIDGKAPKVVDLWAPTFRSGVARSFSGLRPGAHTITIGPTGHARPRATDHLVAVDGFSTAGRGLVRTPESRQRWRTVDSAAAFRGSYAVADLGGASITLRFDGVGVDLTTVTGPDRGRMRVLIDDSVAETIDLYAATKTFGVVHRIDGLPGGVHLLRLEAVGAARAEALGSLVAIDRIDVLAGP